MVSNCFQFHTVSSRREAAAENALWGGGPGRPGGRGSCLQDQVFWEPSSLAAPCLGH